MNGWMDAWLDERVGRQMDCNSGEWMGHFLGKVGGGTLLSQPASWFSQEWGRIENSFQGGRASSTLELLIAHFSPCPVSFADPAPAILLAAWVPVTPTVGAAPAKRMWKAVCVTGR